VLHEGNLRYQRGKLQLRDYSVPGEHTANRQTPFAAIITCADSRLSPPLVFDLHHGNVFVSRVAGNSVDVGTLGHRRDDRIDHLANRPIAVRRIAGRTVGNPDRGRFLPRSGPSTAASS